MKKDTVSTIITVCILSGLSILILLFSSNIMALSLNLISSTRYTAKYMQVNTLGDKRL
jgi:hypothetical protein